ncbi:expressed unknown protein [Seminavis robusta]|uniref:Borealin C-terminal domain-containing protein n=1 Tax=Seminavis robusta TaxID=568900 RepID=A0A9N8DE41_9STRA|nr:expressed unknown protein [Seminavis robusta]|eukprot:Sro80_g043300.1 n/a (255) ;mRNA; f:124615-125561
MPGSRSRTEQLREATKRQIVGVLTDTTNNRKSSTVVDGSDPTHVSLMIQDLQRDFDRRLDAIKSEMLACKQDQYQAHCKGVIKIPKPTRSMTVKEFNQKYNCSLLDLLQNVRAHASEGFASIPAAVCGKRERLETPIPFRGNRTVQTPSTIIRTVRRGEIMFSKNGSPVDNTDEGALVATVTKKRRGNAPPAATANFDINVGEGKYISLNDPSGLQNLDANMKTNAVAQLKVLQDQMATLMEQLTTNEKTTTKN